MRDLIEDLLEATMSVADARAHLGLPVQWTSTDLKSAFKKAAFDNHPDRGGSTAKMAAINVAYKILQKVKPGAGAFSGTKVGSDDWKAQREMEMEKNKRTVMATINGLFDPEKYAHYFTQMTGKPFTFTVEDKVARHGYYSKNVEWTSSDKETIFALYIHVDLYKVQSIKSLGGEGGEPALSFTLMVQPTVLHDNRKSKMKQRDWNFSTKEETLVDPTKIFPKASLKKMMSGADKKRKFSKRDMITAIEQRLKGNTEHSGGTVWAGIPIGEYKLYLYRMVFMREPYWEVHSVKAKVDGKWKTFKTKTMAGYPEAEDLIELLKQIQKHTWNDPQTLIDTAAHQVKSMADAKRAAKTESIRERMENLIYAE